MTKYVPCDLCRDVVGSYWWCPGCDGWVPGVEVNFMEVHVCGRHVVSCPDCDGKPKTGRPHKYGEPMTRRSVWLPDSMWPVIDELAQERGMNRSEFIVKVLSLEIESYNPD